MMRNVTVFEYVRVDSKSCIKKKEKCKPLYHIFGIHYEEFESSSHFLLFDHGAVHGDHSSGPGGAKVVQGRPESHAQN